MRVKLTSRADRAFADIQIIQHIEELVRCLKLDEIKSKVKITELTHDELQLLNKINNLVELDSILSYTGASAKVALELLKADIRQKMF